VQPTMASCHCGISIADCILRRQLHGGAMKLTRESIMHLFSFTCAVHIAVT
jgi:hypothetical protein